MLTSLSTFAAVVASSMTISVSAENYAGEIHYGDGTLAESELADHLAHWAEDAVSDMQDDAVALSELASIDGIPSALVDHEIDHSLKYYSDDFVSILREDHAYTGGASGSTWQIPINWDRARQSLVAIQDIFGEDPETYQILSDLLRGQIERDVWGGNPDGWEAAIDGATEPSPDYMAQFTFAPSTRPGKIGGLTWHFDPYTVAPGARGVQSVTIPQKALEGLVEPWIASQFAGQPAEDLVSSDHGRGIIRK